MYPKTRGNPCSAVLHICADILQKHKAVRKCPHKPSQQIRQIAAIAEQHDNAAHAAKNSVSDGKYPQKRR